MPSAPLGSEVIGQTTNEFGVQIQLVRTPHGDIRFIPRPEKPRHPVMRYFKHPADAFTNPSMWERVTGTGSVEVKPSKAMMTANEMRRFLKGREDL